MILSANLYFNFADDRNIPVIDFFQWADQCHAKETAKIATRDNWSIGWHSLTNSSWKWREIKN